MSAKETPVRRVRQMKSTNIVVVAAFLIIAGFALVSMPQMIGLANAQSERASERACPVPGYTLERGECTAQPIIKYVCSPSSIAGVTAELSGTTCTTTGSTFIDEHHSDVEQQRSECEEIAGGQFEVNKELQTTTCTFAASEVSTTCPGGVPPTDPVVGECITKPGQGNDPT